MNFYVTAAQVIPVLYVAMAFESRGLLRRPDYDTNPTETDAMESVHFVVVALLMAAGELAALAGIEGERGDWIYALVWCGLLSGLVGVVVPRIEYELRVIKKHYEAGGRIMVRALLVLGIFIGIPLVLVGTGILQ